MSADARRFPYVTVAICLAAMAGVAWFLFAFGASLLVAFQAGRMQRNFYIPSQSMMPTLNLNDRIVPMSVDAAPLRRGMIAVFTLRDGDRVDRIVAMGGDLVALREGHVVINGEMAAYRVGDAGPTIDRERTRIVFERLPGEDHFHRTLDLGVSEQDDFAEVRVPAGMLFMLGDNRDRAADSRFTPDVGGVAMVPAANVLGTVDTVMWSKQRARIGRPIDEAITRP